MANYQKAQRGLGKVILFEDKEGERLIKKDGSRAWRNNNPGNIVDSDFSQRHGAIGHDGRFAIFPDYETGRNVLDKLLDTKHYRNLTIEKAMNQYAPSIENNVERYIDYLETDSGIHRTKSLSDLNKHQKNAIMDAIERFEGSIEGETIPIPRKKPVFDTTGRMIRD